MYSQAFPAHGRRGSRLGAGAPASARSSPRGSSAEPLGQCGARQSSPSTVGHKVRWMATPRRSHQRRRHPAAAAVRRPAGTCLNIRQANKCISALCIVAPRVHGFDKGATVQGRTKAFLVHGNSTLELFLALEKNLRFGARGASAEIFVEQTAMRKLWFKAACNCTQNNPADPNRRSFRPERRELLEQHIGLHSM